MGYVWVMGVTGYTTGIKIIRNNNKIIIMPAFSIGKASRDPSFVYHSNTPGVGAYEYYTFDAEPRPGTKYHA